MCELVDSIRGNWMIRVQISVILAQVHRSQLWGWIPDLDMDPGAGGGVTFAELQFDRPSRIV
jgi:hypothetical protein